MLTEYRSRPRDEAIEKIECYIIEHNLTPHAKLPSERDMCDMWGFNRVTLRSAIQRLIREGKIYNKKGSGTFVAGKKLVRNLQDLKSFSQLMADAGQQLTTELISSSVIESNKQVSRRLHLPLGNKVLELSRLRCVDGEPLMIETSYLDCVRFSGLENYDFTTNSLYHVLETVYGTSLAKGQEQVGITYATEEEATLLGLDEGMSLFFVTAVVSDTDDIPIEYIKSVARADRVRFASVLTR